MKIVVESEKLNISSFLKAIDADNEKDIKKIRKEIALKRLGLIKSIETRHFKNMNRADLVFKAIG